MESYKILQWRTLIKNNRKIKNSLTGKHFLRLALRSLLMVRGKSTRENGSLATGEKL
jgi:hypothetical protein